MHSFFTKAKPQVEGLTNLPFLLDVVRWYFHDKNASSPYVVTYAAYFTEQYAKNFDNSVEFDQSTEVELVAYHGDHKTWERSPEDIVSEFFRRTEGVKADEADALAQQYFVSLREQLSDYAVMMYRDRTTEEVIIVTGLKAAQAVRDEKVKAFVHSSATGHSYGGEVQKVTYAK